MRFQAEKEGWRRGRAPRRESAETMPLPSLRRRREGAVAAAAAGRRISRLVYLSGAFLGAAAVAGVEGQYTDGGQVLVDCGRCDCDGTSGDDSVVVVLDNPSSGERIAGIDGEYSEIAETSCGTSIFAVGSTIYELSGVDLESRELEAVEMATTDDCTVSAAPASADCYSGNTAMSLDGGVTMTMTICLCIYEEGTTTIYNSKVSATVQGATDVTIPSDDIEICLDAGFISQLVTANVGDDTYLYNFDLALPGQDSSSDLSVASAPGAAAQAFICGELDPTPAPVVPTPPTPEPTSPPPEPTPEPTPAPVTPTPPTPEPTAPPPDPTPAPVTPLPPPTTAPTAPTPEPTPAPVTPITPPTPEPTPALTPEAIVPPPTAAPIPPLTPSPIAPPETAKPTAAAATSIPETTQEPTAPAGTATPRSLPTASPTASPVLQPGGAATSAPTGGGGVTSAPTAAGPVPATPAPLLSGGVTAAPSSGVAVDESASPTGFGFAGGSATSSSTADDTSGGVATTPAPSSATTATSTTMPSTNSSISDTSAVNSELFFEDKPLSIGGDGRGVDAEVVALALLALLTFFPVCVK